MKGEGFARGEGSGPSSGEGEGSWARVVSGRGPAVEWSSSPLSVREVEDLEAFFSTALVLPEGEIGEEKEKWEGKAVILRSLGRRVPPAWAARDMRLRLGLREEPEVTPIADDHFLVRFDEGADCVRAIQEAPWVVGGQLLAMEPWRPAFVPARQPVSKAVVWLRMPGLPVECWRPSFILTIAAQAGKPISLDSFTEKQRRKGFARVKVEIDSCHPVKPGVVVVAGGERFWQQFQFENLPPVCFLCGMIGHVESGCVGGTEGRSGGGGRCVEPGMPRLGPWISTSRIRQPRAFHSGGARWAGPGLPKSPPAGPSSSSPGSNPRSSSSPPGSPPDSEGWQKPSKVARRVRVAEEEGGKSRVGAEVMGGSGTEGQPFGPLAVVGDPMEVGVLPVSPTECRMTEGDQPVLKRPRSPTVKGKGRERSGEASSKEQSSDSSRSASDLPSLRGSSRGSSYASISILAPHVVGQVRPLSTPCLAGLDLHIDENDRSQEGGRGQRGSGAVLVPIEVKELGEGREGWSEDALGVEEGGLSFAGLGAEEAFEGLGRCMAGGREGQGGMGGASGVSGVGGETLVRVGIREVDLRSVEGLGGVPLVVAEGCAGVGEHSAVREGARGGRVLCSGSEGGGSFRNQEGVGTNRVRSRSPGRMLQLHGEAVGCGVAVVGRVGCSVASEGVPEEVPGGADEWAGSHAEAVEEVREAVRQGSKGTGEASEGGGAAAPC